MSKFIPLILASGLISFITTPAIRKFAQQMDFVDNPRSRKVHHSPMPMLGGVAIYLGLMAAIGIGGTSSFTQLLGVVGGATVVTVTGLLDDRLELNPVLKMGGQIVASLVLVATGVQVNLFNVEALNIALTIFWIVGVSNAINFQDNMDGLAAGLSTVASGFFFMLAIIEGQGLVATLAAAMLGASVGFLYYNFNPATLFMGDAGSLLLGFMLAVLGINLEFAGRPLGATWMIPVIILGVPIFDTTLVVVSRIRRGIPVYQGGKDHTSHRLVTTLDMTHARAVMTMYMAASALGLVAVMLRDATVSQARFILGGIVAIFIFALVWFEVRFKSAS